MHLADMVRPSWMFSLALAVVLIVSSSQLKLVRRPEVNSWGETFGDPPRSSYSLNTPRAVLRERYCFPKGWPEGRIDWHAGYRCLVVECHPLDYVCPSGDSFTFHERCMACDFMRDLEYAGWIVPHYDYDTNDYRFP
ncbi:uncharacterized protein LOC111270755 [Varroa jacobsoni]|uniref:Secreted protein n=1 Tax=Varroa destructor TaxID=109461 RepID=A0A7M7JAL6_VARDE|nr:uncharacterized protein LOC111243007 [Varroa destructor]XP_022706881.1 uncharacterized protein LOC111270755 [Varroa jacobsoni]XP_022706882.1 uncharacterized protein LOC111270755 [Varroa jacobsoni]XP_022706883.1 uncharacterized protein LOC111270755 [Varroa jacobsoni]XP_022706884.1 uncharacterized protein LOC111270755 [Varroa jacobsoni]XP_022706885.1 uncharacterized protein LOC111270755 [Varroa jacobsoni]XP_022706886.1 uncharacterized protein LOC111270755 [Varroa jacobsoni]